MKNSVVSPRRIVSSDVQAVHFERNFIRTAVCELRFPTLFELENVPPPAVFARELRKEYPIYESQADLDVSAAKVAKSHAHVFISRKSKWKVSLRASAISLETSHYDSFPEFRERLAFVLDKAKKVIDSDFFTRVGLRYINAIPFGNEDVSSWINPALVGVLSAGVYDDIKECSQRIIGVTSYGGYLFRHGLEQGHQSKSYVLDYDFYSEDVPVVETLSVLDDLHQREFSMFSWALGERAKEYLGPSTPKG